MTNRRLTIHINPVKYTQKLLFSNIFYFLSFFVLHLSSFYLNIILWFSLILRLTDGRLVLHLPLFTSYSIGVSSSHVTFFVNDS